LVQTPLHTAGAVDGHEHTLPLQMRPPMQTFEQAPQLFESVLGFTHTPLHRRFGATHVGLHAPAVHESPDGHAIEHVPQ
jgi:hypothetical protein